MVQKLNTSRWWYFCSSVVVDRSTLSEDLSALRRCPLVYMTRVLRLSGWCTGSDVTQTFVCVFWLISERDYMQPAECSSCRRHLHRVCWSVGGQGKAVFSYFSLCHLFLFRFFVRRIEFAQNVQTTFKEKCKHHLQLLKSKKIENGLLLKWKHACTMQHFFSSLSDVAFL